MPCSSRTGFTSALFITSSDAALASTLKLLDAVPSAQRIYDVNLREGNWSLRAVEQLASRATVIKLSDSEAEFLDASFGVEGEESSIRRFSERWSAQYNCNTVCLTLGERGCAIFDCGEYVEAPGYKVAVADTVGAGDAFAAGLVHAKSQGWPLGRRAAFANALAALVASRSGAIPDWKIDEVWAMLSGEASS